MPRCAPPVDCTAAPLPTVAMSVGTVIEIVGDLVVGVPAPNTPRILPCEFCVPPQWQSRFWFSPQNAAASRKNFRPPQSVRYVIGSIHAEFAFDGYAPTNENS